MSRLHRVSSPATWSSWKGWTKFRTARASMFRRPAVKVPMEPRRTTPPQETVATAEAAVKAVAPVGRVGEVAEVDAVDERAGRGRANEHFQTVHRSAGSDIAPDDGG